MKDDARAEAPAWWENLTFTHGPETEWFARSVFRDVCRAGKTIYWRCTPTTRSLEELDRRLTAAGFRLVLEHCDRPSGQRRKEHLHRIYVGTDGASVAIVNREGTARVDLSVASLDRDIADRLTEPFRSSLGDPRDAIP